MLINIDIECVLLCRWLSMAWWSLIWMHWGDLWWILWKC